VASLYFFCTQYLSVGKTFSFTILPLVFRFKHNAVHEKHFQQPPEDCDHLSVY